MVWVVASRYVLGDVLIWTSTDGGRTFVGPYEIPHGTWCTAQCYYSTPYTGLGSVDDTLPVLLDYATYDRQLYLTGTSDQPAIYFLQSSANPGLGFNFDATDMIAGDTQFTFANPGNGTVGGSALGTTSAGEVVEAYWLLTTPPTLAFDSFDAQNPEPISAPAGWSGPTVLGAGYLPRMADGAAGLFLLSADSIQDAALPTGVDLREYDPGTHRVGSPRRLTTLTGPASTSLYSGGGLGENYDTGELAAVWPQFSEHGAPLMRLWLATHDGTQFSPAQDIATIGDAYAIDDNARVAIADDGTGFVTFRDANGLQVADLYPLGTQYAQLRRRGRFVNVPVTCPAPKGDCKVTVKLTRNHGGKLAKGRFKLAAGATRKLEVRLGAAALALHTSHHRRLTAQLTIVLHPHGAIAHTTTTRATI